MSGVRVRIIMEVSGGESRDKSGYESMDKRR